MPAQEAKLLMLPERIGEGMEYSVNRTIHLPPDSFSPLFFVFLQILLVATLPGCISSLALDPLLAICPKFHLHYILYYQILLYQRWWPYLWNTCDSAANTALGYPPEQRVRLMFTCNSRGSWKRDPPVPEGFYGCAVVLTVAETTAGDLHGAPLGGAVELVRRAKFDVCDEYVRSTADLLAARRWPPFVVDRTYVVSDITAVGEEELDFGWAKRAGGGVPLAGDVLSKLVSYFMRCRDAQGEDCVAVPMYLPRSAMDRFAQEISALLK